MISFVVFSLLTQTSNPPFLGAILGKLRKFIISPIQYWRDLFYKHPNFARYIPAKIVHRVNKARESEGNPTGGCSSGEDWKDRLALVSRRIKEKNYEEKVETMDEIIENLAKLMIEQNVEILGEEISQSAIQKIEEEKGGTKENDNPKTDNSI